MALVQLLVTACTTRRIDKQQGGSCEMSRPLRLTSTVCRQQMTVKLGHHHHRLLCTCDSAQIPVAPSNCAEAISNACFFYGSHCCSAFKSLLIGKQAC